MCNCGDMVIQMAGPYAVKANSGGLFPVSDKVTGCEAAGFAPLEKILTNSDNRRKMLTESCSPYQVEGD